MTYNDTLCKIKWDKFITDIIDCCDKIDTFKKRLKDLLKPLPIITISSYRKIYEIEAEEQWKQLKSKNRDLFSSFFQRMYMQAWALFSIKVDTSKTVLCLQGKTGMTKEPIIMVNRL